MKFKNLICYGLATVLSIYPIKHSISKNLQNLLKPNKPIYLDIDNDGKKEKILSGYEADSETLFITDGLEYICYSHECSQGYFNLFKKGNNYVFRLSENIYSMPGETCMDFDAGDIRDFLEVWDFQKYRSKDEFIWKQNKLIPQHKWTVQIISFPERAVASKYVDKFLKQGYDVYLQSRINEDNEDYELDHNVLLGSYRERSEAQEALNRFKKKHPERKPFIKSKEDAVICRKL